MWVVRQGPTPTGVAGLRERARCGQAFTINGPCAAGACAGTPVPPCSIDTAPPREVRRRTSQQGNTNGDGLQKNQLTGGVDHPAGPHTRGGRPSWPTPTWPHGCATLHACMGDPLAGGPNCKACHAHAGSTKA